MTTIKTESFLQELNAEYRATHEKVRAWLKSNGFEDGADFVIREFPGAQHNEAAWRARLGEPLSFLFR